MSIPYLEKDSSDPSLPMNSKSDRRDDALHILQWLRAQANAEREPKAKAAFIEAANAALAIIEGRA